MVMADSVFRIQARYHGINRQTTALVGAGIGLIAATSIRTVRKARSAEHVQYEVVDRLADVEIRQYPETLLVETTAADERTAFNRLFQYISGANIAAEELAMTAPVRTNETNGISIPLTAVLRTDETTGKSEKKVTMAFYLPAEYDLETAPVPTDSSVRLITESSRTLGVLSFSWYATPKRTERITGSLHNTLAEHGIAPTTDSFLLRYDPPLTPSFLRTNEVAVEIEEH